MNIEIYSKDLCPYCDMAIHKVEMMMEENIEIKAAVYKLGEDFGREEMMAKFPSARSFPQIVIDDQNIGGWLEFQKI